MSRVENTSTPAPVAGRKPNPPWNEAAFALRLRIALSALALLAAGCSRVPRVLFPNLRPEVRLSSAPVPGEANSYRYLISWVGNDPDGRIAYFQYAVDPPTKVDAETAWVNTTKHEELFSFHSSTPDSVRLPTTASDFHVFVIRAVDDQGARSPVVSRAFFSSTVAPEVVILNPKPLESFIDEHPRVPSTGRITWEGIDPDGPGAGTPVKYKFRMVGRESPDFYLALVDPDSLRRLYAPAFVGWDSVPGETTHTEFRDLALGTHLFVLVAFDEAGAYTPVFSPRRNVLFMDVVFASTSGPKLTMWNEFFFYQYPSGGFQLNPAAEVPLEIPAGQLVRFSWLAQPIPGSTVVGYSWALDDPWHLGTPSATTSATIGPFPSGEIHWLYIEADDSNGLKSLGIVRFRTYEARFDKPLLIVDDTRLAGDRLDNGRIVPPSGLWPTAAELDTFLFARGGVPWRTYPPGTLSSPGMFAGYPFDTLGTRTGRLDITIPLSVLANYRNIVWIVDGNGALNGNGQESPTDRLRPPAALRFMSSPGRENTLSAWLSQGGRLWLLGGRAGYASMIPWDLGSNNTALGTVFGGGAYAPLPRPELTDGRLMYDFVHWRSEFITPYMPQPFEIRRSVSATSWPGGPDYLQLPERLDPKDPAFDPLPPYRTASQFYRRERYVEFLQKPNRIVEQFDPGRRRQGPLSTLDTLYSVTGATMPAPDQNPENVAMTVYHGLENSQVIFSGFDLWGSRRDQCQQLVDFVLQNIWGMSRAPLPARAVRPAAATAGAASARRR